MNILTCCIFFRKQSPLSHLWGAFLVACISYLVDRISRIRERWSECFVLPGFCLSPASVCYLLSAGSLLFIYSFCFLSLWFLVFLFPICVCVCVCVAIPVLSLPFLFFVVFFSSFGCLSFPFLRLSFSFICLQCNYTG